MLDDDRYGLLVTLMIEAIYSAMDNKVKAL